MSGSGQFIITGKQQLKGTISPSGNKNAALPLIAAALLTDQPVTLSNLPRIGDVETLLELLRHAGVETDFSRDNTADHDVVTIKSANLTSIQLNAEQCRKIRGSLLLAAPLLQRLGKVTLPFPGGDRIGRRRIDTHLLALQELGAVICEEKAGSLFSLSAPEGLHGADILLDEASVTATENTLMAAAFASGETIIRNAACEPHVQELCQFLQQYGVKIDGVSSNMLTVQGIRTFGTNQARIGADYIEVGSLIALAAITDSDVTITDAALPHLRMILHQFRRLGIDCQSQDDGSIRVKPGQRLTVQNDFRGAVPKIDSSPWPGFPADLLSIVLVAATQALGSVLIFEKLFESRLFFVDQLIEMGARIVLCDPHRAVVMGPSQLKGSWVRSPDIRAGMALIIAALAAEGETRIDNILQIDRGYRQIDQRLRKIGALIERC